MILQAPPEVGEEDLLKGLEIIHWDIHGRLSLSDRVGLKAVERWGEVPGLVARPALTPAEVLLQ